MDIPQQLVGKIVGCISPNDRISLRNCSLVAKSWVQPCRRRLFETIDVSGSVRLGRWLDRIPPTNAGMLLQHVRSITCYIADSPDSPHGTVDLLRDYSSSFRQLERLTFDSGCPPSLARIEMYAGFQHSLSYLSLRSFRVAASVVVALVDYFPNLTHLNLSGLSPKVDDQRLLPFSRPLQQLTIAEFTFDGLPLLDQLMGLHPRCDKITIELMWISCPSFAQRVINGVKANVKRLDLKFELIGVSKVSKYCNDDG